MITLAAALRRLAPFALVLCLAVVLGCGGSSGTSSAGGAALQVTSTSFAAGGTIPAMHAGTMGGCAPAPLTHMNVSPQLSWSGAPAGTQSHAIVVYDETNPWVHWILHGIPANVTSVAAAYAPAPPVYAWWNTFGNLTYDGPCPPPGTHTYVFTVYALNVADMSTVPGYAAALAAQDSDAFRSLIVARSIASGSVRGTFP